MDDIEEEELDDDLSQVRAVEFNRTKSQLESCQPGASVSSSSGSSASRAWGGTDLPSSSSRASSGEPLSMFLKGSRRRQGSGTSQETGHGTDFIASSPAQQGRDTANIPKLHNYSSKDSSFANKNGTARTSGRKLDDLLVKTLKQPAVQSPTPTSPPNDPHAAISTVASELQDFDALLLPAAGPRRSKMRGAGDRQEREKARRRLQRERDKAAGGHRAEEHQLLSEMVASAGEVVESKPKKKFAALDAFQSVLLEQDGRPKQATSPQPPQAPSLADSAEATAAVLGPGAEVSHVADLRAQDVQLQRELEAQKLAMHQQLHVVGNEVSQGHRGLYDELNAELADVLGMDPAVAGSTAETPAMRQGHEPAAGKEGSSSVRDVAGLMAGVGLEEDEEDLPEDEAAVLRALRAVEVAETAEKQRGRDVERARQALEKQSREQEEVLGRERAALTAELAEQARALADGDPDKMRQSRAEVKKLLGDEDGRSLQVLRSRGSGQRQEAVHKRALAGRQSRGEGSSISDHQNAGGGHQAAELVTSATGGEGEASIATRLEAKERAMEAEFQHQHKAMKAELLEQARIMSDGHPTLLREGQAAVRELLGEIAHGPDTRLQGGATTSADVGTGRGAGRLAGVMKAKKTDAQSMAREAEEEEGTRPKTATDVLQEQEALHQQELASLKEEMRRQVQGISSRIAEVQGSRPGSAVPDARFRAEVQGLLDVLGEAPQTATAMEGGSVQAGMGRGSGNKLRALAGHKELVQRAEHREIASQMEEKEAAKARIELQAQANQREVAALRGAIRQELEGLQQTLEEERDMQRISPAQEKQLMEQIMAAKSALEEAGAGVGPKLGARTRGGLAAAIQRRREALMEKKFGPVPSSILRPTTPEGSPTRLSVQAATIDDEARRKREQAAKGKKPLHEIKAEEHEEHLRKKLFWQGEKTRLAYLHQKNTLKSEIAEMMQVIRNMESDASPEEIEQYKSEVQALQLMLDQEDEDEAAYDLGSSSWNSQKGITSGSIGNGHEGKGVGTSKHAGSEAENWLEQKEAAQKHGARGRRGLEAALAKKRQEKAKDKVLYAAEEKALETILEQKHRRRELQRAELAAEKKQLKKAKAQRRDERAREMEALENIVLHALEAERSQAEAVLAQAQAEVDKQKQMEEAQALEALERQRVAKEKMERVVARIAAFEANERKALAEGKRPKFKPLPALMKKSPADGAEGDVPGEVCGATERKDDNDLDPTPEEKVGEPDAAQLVVAAARDGRMKREQAGVLGEAAVERGEQPTEEDSVDPIGPAPESEPSSKEVPAAIDTPEQKRLEAKLFGAAKRTSLMKKYTKTAAALVGGREDSRVAEQKAAAAAAAPKEPPPPPSPGADGPMRPQRPRRKAKADVGAAAGEERGVASQPGAGIPLPPGAPLQDGTTIAPGPSNIPGQRPLAPAGAPAKLTVKAPPSVDGSMSPFGSRSPPPSSGRPSKAGSGLSRAPDVISPDSATPLPGVKAAPSPEAEEPAEDPALVQARTMKARAEARHRRAEARLAELKALADGDKDLARKERKKAALAQADLEKVDNEEKLKREAEEAAAAKAQEQANKSLFGGTVWRSELEDDEDSVEAKQKQPTKKKLRASDIIKGTSQIALGTIGEDEVFVEEEEQEQVKCNDKNNDDDDDEDEIEPKQQEGEDDNRREKKKRRSSESMRRLLRAFGIDPTPFKTRNDLKHAVIIAQKSESTKRASQREAAEAAAAAAEAAAIAKNHKPREVVQAAKRSRPVTDVWESWAVDLGVYGVEPISRSGHTMCTHALRQVLFGGAGGSSGTSFFNDVYTLDAETLEWQLRACVGDQPSPRAYHSMTTCYPEEFGGEPRMLMFGGWAGQRCNAEMYVLEGVHLQERRKPLFWSAPMQVGVKPTARSMHSASMVVLRPDGDSTSPRVVQKLYVFGGWAGGNIFLNDMYAFDVDLLNWSKVLADEASPLPAPRGAHTTVAVGRKLYVFGGQSKAETLSDLWVFDTDKAEWTQIKQTGAGPGARSGHSACFLGRYMYIFGGFDGRRPWNDLYRLDVASCIWEELNLRDPPFSRSGHAATLCGMRWFVNAGWSQRGFLQDTHALDLLKILDINVKVTGGPLSSSLHQVKVSFAKGKPPPITVQWYRSIKDDQYERIQGATGLSYLPNADDINNQLGVACLPCSGKQPLGVSYFQVLPPVQLDPEMSRILRGLVAQAYAEFRVRLLGGDDLIFLTLIMDADGFKLRDGLRTRVKDVYRDTFKIVLSVTKQRNFVFHLKEGSSFPMCVEHTHERDILALVGRSFWAMNRERWIHYR